MVLEGDSAVEAARQVIGATNPLQSAPGSIRGDFAIAIGTNMVHGSDSPESAAREVGLFFPELVILASGSPSAARSSSSWGSRSRSSSPASTS